MGAHDTLPPTLEAVMALITMRSSLVGCSRVPGVGRGPRAVAEHADTAQ